MPLFKHKGDGRRFECYRGILLSCTWGKRFHWWIRSSLIPHFLQHSAPLQCGVSGGHSTAHLSLLVRTFQGSMKARNLSHAVIFLDFTQAFYSVFRHFLVRFPHTPQGFLDFCKELGVSDAQAAAILHTLDQPEDAITSSLAPHLHRRLHDALQVTWFQVNGAAKPCQTARGSRPGDPLADLLFGVILAPPLKRLAAKLQGAGIVPDIVTGGVFPGTRVDEFPCPCTAAWHDDVILPIAADKAEALISACSHATALASGIFEATGLILNFCPNKTEVMAMPLGKGQKDVLSVVFDPGSPCIPVHTREDGALSVKLTSTYRHLGSLVQSDGGLVEDVGFRLQSARKGLAPLAEPIFGRNDVPL